MKESLRIIIQEFDDEIRNELEKNILSDARFHLIKSYKSFYLLTEEFRNNKPHLVLINWSYSTEELFRFLRYSIEKIPDIKIIISFDFVQPDFIFKAIANGATGILLKPFSGAEILRAPHIFSFNPKLNLHLHRLAADEFGNPGNIQ